jgi:GDP-L-fucose synthase
VIKDEVLKSFAGSSSVVTGGTGMIGRQVVKLLCDAGSHVRVVSLDDMRVDDRADHIYGDLTNFELCREVTGGVDYVFHLAGIKGSMKVSGTMLASHFVPTLMFNTNLLEAARLNNVKKLVYTSSIGAYANAEILREGDNPDAPPMDFAGWAKRMGELQIHAYKVQYGLDTFSIVRPANVYGPGDNFDPENAMVVGSLMTRIDRKEDPVVVWGDGSAIRDMAFSRDIAEGVILALYHGTKGKFVNLGGPRGYSVRELVETLAEFLDFNYLFDAEKPSGWPKRVMDNTLARQTIDYNPTTSLLEGLKETWQWFQENKQEYLLKKNYFQKG